MYVEWQRLSCERLWCRSTYSRNLIWLFFVLMMRRPPRSTQGRSSAASDVYKRQVYIRPRHEIEEAFSLEQTVAGYEALFRSLIDR